MEKSQYELCAEVLRRLSREGVLNHVVIVGSWCMLSYGDFFSKVVYRPAIRTRDIDILVPLPPSFTLKVDVESILKDLDFVIGFRGRQGNISFVHSELTLEFLVPERGRGSDRPYPLPALGANAQRLRYLEFLLDQTIWGTLGGVRVRLPHPARFAIHKLMISTRRTKAEKRERDREQGIYILDRLIAIGRKKVIRKTFEIMPATWQKLAQKALFQKPEGADVLRAIFG